MKKINLNKRSTEFGAYHENENEINSHYDSLERNNSNEQKDSSDKKEECYTGSCHSKSRNQKSNR